MGTLIGEVHYNIYLGKKVCTSRVMNLQDTSFTHIKIGSHNIVTLIIKVMQEEHLWLTLNHEC